MPLQVYVHGLIGSLLFRSSGQNLYMPTLLATAETQIHASKDLTKASKMCKALGFEELSLQTTRVRNESKQQHFTVFRSAMGWESECANILSDVM